MFLARQSQKKNIIPNTEKVQIKPVKDTSFVDLSRSAPLVTNVLSVVEGILVGARLQKFWRVLAAKGLSPRVVLILKERFSLKLKITREPLLRSTHANPFRNSYLKEALHSLLQKQTMEKVKTQSSLEFYNRLFLVPKPNQKWWPILDLNTFNQFLKIKSFKWNPKIN